MKKLTYVLATVFTTLSLALVGTVSYAYAATAAHVNIQNFAFSPSSISVHKGTTVTWTNRDNTAHTVTGNTSGGPSSGHIQPGKSYSFTFNSTGTFPYHCSIHPAMMGKVTVMASTMSQPPASPPSAPSTHTGTSGNMGSMQMSTKPSSSESSEHQIPPTQLPNTGSSKAIPLFTAAAGVGMSVYYLILLLLRKLS